MDDEPDNHMANGLAGDVQGRDHRAAGNGKRVATWFGVAMVTGENPLPLHILDDLMDHSSTATTEISTRVIGGEKQKMVLRVWENN